MATDISLKPGHRLYWIYQSKLLLCHLSLVVFFSVQVVNRAMAEQPSDASKNSRVRSVYINDAGVFAFVEFSSIELTTACLALDGEYETCSQQEFFLTRLPTRFLRLGGSLNNFLVL